MLASRLLVALAAAFLLWLSLPGTFVFDDHSLFVDPAVVPLDAWRQWLKLEQTRPLTYVSFWLDFHLWGAQSAGFRFTNLLLHCSAASLLLLSARRLFDGTTALLAAAVFALHPLTHEPLLYIFARGGSLAAVFCLLSLWFWLKDRPMAAVAAFAASLLAKEEWVAFPLALVLIDFARARKPKWAFIAGMLVMAMAAGARVIYATKVVAGAGSGLGQQTTPWNYFLMQGEAIAGYGWRIAVPMEMSIDPPAPSDGLVVWGLLVIAVSAASWFWTRTNQSGFWLLPSFVLLLPSSSILPAADAVAFRRMYLPMAFLAIGVVLAFRKWPRALVALLLLWTALGAARRATWGNERAIWMEAADLAPGKLRPYLQLSRLSAKDEALRYLDKAKEIAPYDPEVASERGRVWLEAGDAAHALPEFGRALALDPRRARHLQNRGAALLALGQTDAARADFESALRRDPCLKPARENLTRLGVQLPPSTCPTTNFAVR